MSSEHYVEHANLSLAWSLAVRSMMTRGGPSEIAPVTVAITGFDANARIEDGAIRTALDAALDMSGMQSCHTVANTIFPESMWNPGEPRALLFERYAAAVPRLKQASKKNRRGLYFQRLIQGGPPGNENQLDFIIQNHRARTGVRRSALQVAVFDPKLDLTSAAQLGFPCLQHVTFAPTAAGLCINAFYATQYAFERAYGNYLGLCRLGRFVAHELAMPLTRVTCFTGIMLRDQAVSQRVLKPVAGAIDIALQKEGTKS